MIDVDLVGDWTAFNDAIDPDKFKARLESRLAVANRRIGAQFRATSQRWIRSRKFEPNSPITIILKGSSAPLVDGGDLFQQLTWDSPNPYELRLGVVRQRAGDDLVNVGLIVHEGATINVGLHPQVRRKVWAMVSEALRRSNTLNPRQAKSVGAAAESLGSGAQAQDVWVIPGRPFILGPLQSPALVGFMRKQITEAARAAFKGGS